MNSPWPTKKLSKCVEEGLIELKRGIVISEKDMKECPGPYPVYSSSSQNNGFFGTYGRYMFDEELITWSVDGGGYFFYRPKHKFSVTNVVGILRLLTDELIYKFVYYHLVWQRSRLEFDYVKKAHPSVIKDLYEIPFPPLPIQQKIVKILDTIQSAVEIQEKIIEKTKELKKSLMAELFKYGGPSFRRGRKLKKTEIGEIPEDWEVVRLGEVCRLRVEQVFPKEDEIYVGLEHIDSGEIRLNRYGKGAQVRSLKNKFYANDILYNKLRPYLDKAVIVENEGVCSTDLLVIKCNEEKILPHYLINLLHTPQFLNFATSTMTGTNHPRTSWEFLKIFKLPLPPLPEQQEIAEILQTIDQKIEIEKKKKELYEELFRTMLNKLMNGEIKVDNIKF
jgi:type I restriction enzyme S subunit